MTEAKRKRMLELADTLAKENQRLVMSKNMLRIVISDAARDVIVEALQAYASPPEQPAAAPGTGRVELIEQCAKIADPWSGFIDADKMGAADNAVIKVRNDIAAAIRSLKETQA
jgi:hypothetical protein